MRFIEPILQNRVTDPEKVLFTFLNQDEPATVISAGRLTADVEAWAGSAGARGVRPGTLVALGFAHGYELVCALLGVMAAGAVPCILPYFRSEMRAADYAAQIQDHLATLGQPLVVTEAARQDALAAAIPPPSNPVPLDNPPLYVQLSSGTTAAPKAIPIFAAQLDHYLDITGRVLALTTDDVAVGWLPLHHDMGLVTQLWQPLYDDYPSYLIAPAHWLRAPETLFHACANQGGTITWMPNFALAYCVRHLDPTHFAAGTLQTMRILGCGSEPVQSQTLDTFAEAFAPLGLRRQTLTVGYGMAEHVAGITITDPDHFPRVDWVDEKQLQQHRAQPAAPDRPGVRAIVSCGRPKPTLDLRIVDDEGIDQPARAVGEVWLRGGALFSGYLNPATTEQSFQAGWYRTGDLGYLVDDELFICGRKNDLIISAGRNLSPHRLEQIAAQVLGPTGRYAVAFGVPDPDLGSDAVVLICEVRGRPDEATWVPRLRRQIQQIMDVSPRQIQLVPRGWIVKTTSGKINRAANQAKYIAQTKPAAFSHINKWPIAAMDQAALTSALQAEFTHLLGQAAGPADDFFHLGGTSLGFMHLVLTVERKTGKAMAPRLLRQRCTPERMATLLSAATPHEEEGPQPQTSTARPRRRRGFRDRLQLFLRHGPRPKARQPGYERGRHLLPPMAYLMRRLGAFRQIQATLHALARAAKVPDSAHVSQRSFELNLWRNWRLRQFSEPATRQRWLTVTGREYVAAAHSAGRGLILLHTHTVMLGLAPWLLQDGPFPHQITIGRWHQDGRPEAVAGQRQAAAQLLQGVHCLQQGGLVHIAGDGHHTEQGAPFSFFGRQRRFGRGFVELARQTGAAVLPVFITVGADDHVTAAFLPPLPPPEAAPDPTGERMMTAYLDHLRHYWRHHLANISWGDLYLMRSLPETVSKLDWRVQDD